MAVEVAAKGLLILMASSSLATGLTHLKIRHLNRSNFHSGSDILSYKYLPEFRMLHELVYGLRSV